MCPGPGYERSHSGKPRRSQHHARVDSSFGLWQDVSFSSLHEQQQRDSDFNNDEDDDDERRRCQESSEREREEEDDDDEVAENESLSRRRRRRASGTYFVDRQMYLHSYTFCRKRSLQDRIKSSLRRLKAAALAIVACNHNHHSGYGASTGSKPFARRFKDKVRRFSCGASRRDVDTLCALPVLSCKRVLV